jgi:hypothetical protein
LQKIQPADVEQGCMSNMHDELNIDLVSNPQMKMGNLLRKTLQTSASAPIHNSA